MNEQNASPNGQSESAPQTESPSSASNSAARPVAQQKVSFQQLAKGAAEVLVEHDGQVYRLRLTRNGKLILNK